MSRPLFAAILTALVVSLWFNWRSQHGVTSPEPPAKPPLAPAPVLPGTIGEMDFSGTGLSDEAWQLKADLPGDPIPSAAPAHGSSLVPPAPAPVPKAWDDSAIHLTPSEAGNPPD